LPAIVKYCGVIIIPPIKFPLKGSFSYRFTTKEKHVLETCTKPSPFRVESGEEDICQTNRDDLRSQQILQDVLVLDGGRSVVFPILLDLLICVLLPEKRHLALVLVDLARVRTMYISLYATYPVSVTKRHTLY